MVRSVWPGAPIARALVAAAMLTIAGTPAQAGGGVAERAIGQSRGAHFAIAGGQFLLDGKPYLIRSGEMHYPRIPRDEWHDRLRKARAMGLNAITTYAFWNVNEPKPGKFDFTGNGDIAAFIRTAAEEGLNVIVRPGPYVCAEWDFGGMPGWLLATPGLRVRSLDPRFMAASQAWFNRLHQELAPLLSSHGGPILMMQVENEYGSYGDDHDYLEAIHKQMVQAGFDLPLFTSNGPGPDMLESGSLPGMQSVVNFDGDVADAQAAFKESEPYLAGMPKMAGEYWDGWFDHWGEPHHTRSPEMAARVVDWFLSQGISFNLYMVDGGSNFGWMAGANGGAASYMPTTTSYDYDAPIDEAGRYGPKYNLLRKVIAAHLPEGESIPAPPPPSATQAIGPFKLTSWLPLTEALPVLSKANTMHRVQGMERLGQEHGYVLYKKKLDHGIHGPIDIRSARDFVTVIGNGKVIGTIDRRLGQHEANVDLAAGSTLGLLVENMGRVNYGPDLPDEAKGLIRTPRAANEDLFDWKAYSLPLDDLSALRFKAPVAAPAAQPAFWRGTFKASAGAGTFLDMSGWTLGHLWINGHDVGRFWNIGPQKTLYVPASWLRQGSNDIIVLDVTGRGGGATIAGDSNPRYSQVKTNP
ncbi:beta-galactosidase family protein [Pinirhizobacter sp.]|uniref:glycoside hydrolase family 35 protein n=1 Tax=Pinirhizobacter sp. TaxID=2950432 RepID=UPI002F3FE1C1